MLKFASYSRGMAVHRTQALCRTTFSYASFAGRCRLGSRAANLDNIDNYVELANGSVFYKQESNNLKCTFRYIVSDLAKLYADIPDAAGSLEQVLVYNIPGGKLYRALTFLHAYTQLLYRCIIPEDSPKQKYIMAICIELVSRQLQASGLVLDDLVDGSELRRGRPSWPSLRNSASNVALNDVSMMKSSVFTLLHRHFGSQLYYLRILQLFHQVLHKTFLGQALDLKSHNSDGKPRLELFTMNRYRSIAKYKTGFYTFYFPVSIAIIMAGCNDVDEMTQLEDILFEMGIFYQIQNDYWDCYQDSGLTGKSGNDVKEGKCTWLSVVALQSASTKQKAAFQECYGRPCCSHTSVIKDLYEQLDIHSKYKDYEQKTYDKLFAKICQIQHCVPHHVLFSILNMLFRKRTDVGLYR